MLGWDLNAALALGAALGIPAAALAELLPPVEAAMVKALNKRMRAEASAPDPSS